MGVSANMAQESVQRDVLKLAQNETFSSVIWEITGIRTSTTAWKKNIDTMRSVNDTRSPHCQPQGEQYTHNRCTQVHKRRVGQSTPQRNT